jgi:glutamate-1-semialdehyde 2,1-aminomutase
MVMSWGPLIHGHDQPKIREAIRRQVGAGATFGAPTEVEILLAEKIASLMPSIKRLRFVNSGTEATMSALRLARAFTDREIVVKFDGCYHGHVDSLLIRAGSGLLTHGVPSGSGISAAVTQTTRGLPFNDVEAFTRLMATEGEHVAAVILEPVPGNMGVIPPAHDFIDAVRNETLRYGSLLIFDEVITGFRVGLGGAQLLLGVTPDLTCLGKIIGGGLPVAAFGGRREVMDMLSPIGPVYQAGTLSGNPVGMAAGLAALTMLEECNYDALGGKAARLAAAVLEAAHKADVAVAVNQFGSMLSPFFQIGPVENLETAQTSDAEAYARFFHGMLDAGVYLAPSQYETWMLSFAHSDGDLDHVVSALEPAMRRAKGLTWN